MAKAGYREKKIRPVWPIYAAGAIFVIYSAIAPIYKPSHFVIACVLAIAAYVAGTIFSPAKVEQVEVDYKTGNNDADAIIVRGRETTARLRDAFTRITDPELKTYVSRTERALTRMIDTVAQTPAKAAHVKKFVNYYLPTTLKLLDSYAKFEEAGIEGENLSRAQERIEETMDALIKGFDKQLDDLYRNEAMDIDSDIRVMENMLRRDTASVEDDFGLGGAAVQHAPDEE